MTRVKCNVTEIDFDGKKLNVLDNMQNKVGTFVVLVYTQEAYGATAGFLISKNATSMQIMRLTNVAGKNGDTIDLQYVPDGNVIVKLDGTPSAISYHAKVIG